MSLPMPSGVEKIKCVNDANFMHFTNTALILSFLFLKLKVSANNRNGVFPVAWCACIKTLDLIFKKALCCLC